MISARKLIENVNSGDTLTQEELFPLFSRASFLVDDCVRLLIQENNYIQLCVVDLGAEVAANLDRNKAIYRRSVAYVEGSAQDVKADAEKRQADFLCACMDLQLAVLTGDLDSQLEIVLGLPLTRMIFERFVKEWHDSTEGYVSRSLHSAATILSGDYANVSDSDLYLDKIERESSLDPRTAFGLIRYVSVRLSALSRIYDRIFNAYSRVILKLAKGQAVSEDHSLDCFQNGSFGLLRAVSSYDHVSNARFVGHARWWIRQTMLLHLKEHSNIIRVSSNTWQHYAKLEDIKRKHESKHGPMDAQSLAKASGYSKSHVESIYSTVRASQVRSLDYPIKPDGSTTLSNFVDAASDEPRPFEYTAEDSVKVLLGNLPPDLRNLVCLNFGLTEYVVQDLDPGKVELERKNQTT